MPNTNRVLVTLSAIALALMVPFFILPSVAQDGVTKPTTQDEINKQLLDRIRELENQVKELKGKPTAAPLPIPPPMVETAAPDDDTHKLQIIGFGDVGYQANDQHGNTNSFLVGSLDLFFSASLSERFSTFSELVFLPGSDNAVGIDLERIMLQYRQNRYFNIGVGRYHTDIGYYNTAFHHAQFLQTTLDRPRMYAFDDQEGYMSLQEIGMSANGELPSGKLGLHWVAQIGNGRNHLLGAEPAQNKIDVNNDKAFNLAVFARPSQTPGLQTGMSFYRDVVTLNEPPVTNQRILAAYAVYSNAKYEWLNEGSLTSNVRVGGRVFHTPGFYTQFSRAYGKYRPYARYSYVNSNLRDPLFGGEDGTRVLGRQNDLSLGARYDLNEYAAFKLQYDHYNERTVSSWNRMATQFAFTF